MMAVRRGPSECVGRMGRSATCAFVGIVEPGPATGAIRADAVEPASWLAGMTQGSRP